jgi:hypothetical protein
MILEEISLIPLTKWTDSKFIVIEMSQSALLTVLAMSSVSTNGTFANLDAARETCFVPPPRDEKLAASIRDSVHGFLYQIETVFAENGKPWSTQDWENLTPTREWLEGSFFTFVCVKLEESFLEARKRFDRIAMPGRAQHRDSHFSQDWDPSRIPFIPTSVVDELTLSPVPNQFISENFASGAEAQVLGTQDATMRSLRIHRPSDHIFMTDLELGPV